MTTYLSTLILPSGQRSNGVSSNNGIFLSRMVHTFTESEYLSHEEYLSPSELMDILEANKDIEHLPIHMDESKKDLYPSELFMDPFERASNVSNSFVEINKYNEIMAKHGVNKRDFTTLHKKDAENRNMNKYLDHMVRVLNYTKGEPELFWKLCFRLGRQSNVFLALMLTEYDPNWHRNMTLKELHLVIYKLRTMWRSNPYDLSYRRVYIPKEICPDTGLVRKYRPLGVPKVMWRTYLHAWNQFLMIFLSLKIPLSQHGFFSGRGTKTAWEQILKEVLPSKDIYEFDLKGFFPSVNVAAVMDKLDEWGVPSHILKNLYWMGQMPPRLHPAASEHFVDESISVFKNELLQAGLLNPEKDWYDIKYTENSEFELLESLDRTCRYVFDNQYDVLGDGTEYGHGPKVNLQHLKQFPGVFPILDIDGGMIPDTKTNNLKEGKSLMVYTGEVLKDLFIEHNLTYNTITHESYQAYLQHLRTQLLCDRNVLNHTNSGCDEATLIAFLSEPAKFLKDKTLNPTSDLVNESSYELLHSLGYDPNSEESILKFISDHLYQMSYVYYGKFIRKGAGHQGLNRGEIIYELIEEEGKEDVWIERYNPLTRLKENEGFPQGSPISPILCSAILGDSVFQLGKCVMYADDGLFYGNLKGFQPEPNQAMRTANLSFATKKSRWVKQDNVWLSPLKFLGLTYTGEPNHLGLKESLVGSTKDKIKYDKILAQDTIRLGSTLPFDKQLLVTEHLQMKESKGKSISTDYFKIEIEDHKSLGSYAEALYNYRVRKHEPILKTEEAIAYPEATNTFFKKAIYKLYVEDLQLQRSVTTKAQSLLPPSQRMGIDETYSESNYDSLLVHGNKQLLCVILESLWKTYIQDGTLTPDLIGESLTYKQIHVKFMLIWNTLGLLGSEYDLALKNFSDNKLDIGEDIIFLDERYLHDTVDGFSSESKRSEMLYLEIYDHLIEHIDPLILKIRHSLKDIQPFTWSLLVESELFGFVQARLYGGEWNSSVKQDFTLKYVPRSWMWYKQFLLRSPFSRLTYNIEDSHEILKQISKEEFYKILRVIDREGIKKSSLSFGEKLKVRSVEIRNYRGKSVSLDGMFESLVLHPELNVFNSPSLAFSSLVSLFENENKFASCIEEYESIHNVKLTVRQRKVIKSYLSLGYKSQILFMDPTLLLDLPNFGRLDEEWSSINEKVFWTDLTSKEKLKFSGPTGTYILSSKTDKAPSIGSSPKVIMENIKNLISELDLETKITESIKSLYRQSIND